MSEPLRLAQAQDVDLLCQLMQEFYDESGYPLERGEARTALAALATRQELGRLWLILSQEQPAGYVALTFGFSLEYTGRDAFIDDLYIRPEARGQGLGSRVLEAVERESARLGVRALHLEVERGNAAAQSLYRKRGFRDNDRQLLTKRLAG